MAIITDPDNLDREQVIFGTDQQIISLYQVGALAHIHASGTNAYTTGSSTEFSLLTGSFSGWGIAAGDIVCMYTNNDAGHFEISSLIDETRLLVTSASFAGSTVYSASLFSGSTGQNVVYEIREATGGSIVDGVTEQGVYSFAKEEWRVDTKTFGSDDLIRHEFPFEAITREQMEAGGSTAHADWDWFNTYTRKKVRTGGWAHKNLAGTSLDEYTGIVTLGSLDANAQVYYQQLSASSVPANFDFQGAVNEALETSSSLKAFDSRDYLKIFVRKKARSYAQQELSDIGVSSLETIVNRFPLTHITDAAIAASDAEISGSTPWREKITLNVGTNGVTADVNTDTGTITSAGALFLSNSLKSGDVCQVQGGGSDAEFYTILSINSNNQITVNTTEQGGFVGDSGLTFECNTTIIISGASDGATQTVVSGTTSAITSAAGGFQGRTLGTSSIVIAADDLLIIRTPGNDRGIYKVTSIPSDTILVVDSTDHNLNSGSDYFNNVVFEVTKPGMYLQYKQDNLGYFNAGNLTFANANPDTITRATSVWASDVNLSGTAITTGSIITIAGTTSNNGSFTVASVDGAIITLVASDTLTPEGPVSASITAYDPFKRAIQNITYGFKWRCFGNNSLLSNIFQYVQHQLRRTINIDHGQGLTNPTNRGDVTDLLMSFATPTATTFDMIIDDLNAADANNVTYTDATGVTRTDAFQSVGNINFSTTLQNDANAIYWMFFTTTPDGNFGTPQAIIVNDADNIPITGNISGAASVQFTFDYDNNIQGSRTSQTDAAVTVVAIGLSTAQYVLAQGTIDRTKAVSISLVAATERNYSNA